MNNIFSEILATVGLFFIGAGIFKYIFTGSRSEFVKNFLGFNDEWEEEDDDEYY